jgi:hypothetical protein
VVLGSEQRAAASSSPSGVTGFAVEGGPDGFLAAEPELQSLAAELGIADRWWIRSRAGRSCGPDAHLEPLPKGRAAAVLGITGIAREDLHKGFRSFATGMAGRRRCRRRPAGTCPAVLQCRAA